MNKAFSNFKWENEPSVNTPLSANNLNKVNNALNEVDNRVVTHETTKANQTDMLTAITNVSLDEKTGIFTFTRHNGTSFTVDTKLEKIVLNYYFDSATQTLYLILEDETQIPVDLSAFITNVEFADSNTIRYSITDGGKVVFDIIDGSITGDKLEPNYLSNVQLASTSATHSAESAESSALRAEAAADRAESVSNVQIATTTTAGIVKPDGITITITSDGTISAQTSSGGGVTEEELNQALAKYLPVSGGKLTGGARPLDIKNTTSGGVGAFVGFETATAYIGALGISEKKPTFAQASADGGNQYELIHTGNIASHALSLNGGGMINKPNGGSVITLNTSQTTYNYLSFIGTGKQLGYLGFTGVNNPVFISDNTQPYTLHHDGNSAKVVVSESAPSDTTSVWIDTTNKKIKSYIDGAWTVV